jgi:hypothetical protein
MRSVYKILVGEPQKKRPIKKNWRMWKKILKSILGKQILWVWIGLIWFSVRLAVGCCEHGNEPSDSIEGGELLGQLSVLSVPPEGVC